MKILTARVEFNTKQVKPNQAMLDHWAYRTGKRLPLLPIFAVVHLSGSTQPAGYIQTWSINLAAVKTKAKEIGGKTSVVKLMPPKKSP